MARQKVHTNVIDMTWCSCSLECRRYLYVEVTQDGRYLRFKVEVPHHRYLFWFDRRSLRKLFKTLLKSVDHLDRENQEMVRGLISQMTSPRKEAA